MKVSSYIYMMVATMLLLALGGCKSEDDIVPIKKEDCCQLQFSLSVLPPQTRALTQEAGVSDPLNENKISSMDAFLFDDTGVQRGHFSTTKGDLVVNAAFATSGTATAYVPKDSGLSPIYSGNNFHLYVLVNYHGTANLTGKTLNDLKAIVLTTDDLKQSEVKAQDDFLMDGTIKTGVITWNVGNHYNHNVGAVTGQTVKLARAAAKIRIRLGEVDLRDKQQTYSVVGSPTIALKSYVCQTTLFAGAPVRQPEYLFMDDGQPMVQVEHGGKTFWTREVPFYSYENDWADNGSTRTYAVLKLRIKGDQTGKESDTYYSVPLNYLVPKDGMTPEEIAGISKLQRNHLYDIECSIKQLGSAEPTKPTTLYNGYIAIEDWNSPDAIDAVITKAHYLVVKELRPEMLNVNTRKVEYLSDLDIDVEKMNSNIETEFTKYDLEGESTPEIGHNENKTIKIDTIYEDGRKYLKITSPIPVNYVPLTIRFTVSQKPDKDDGSSLSKDVVVTQYPPIYVTAKKSSGNPIYWYSPFGGWNDSGPTGRGGYQTNGTLFKVTTLAPQAGQIVGDPTFGTDKTDRSEEANKITSPQFIIASQWGMSTSVPQYGPSNTSRWGYNRYNYASATGNEDRYYTYTSDYYYRYRDYNNAEERAFLYWEDDYGTSGTRTIHGDFSGQGFYGRWTDIQNDRTMSWSPTFKYEGHWRIPTLAELKLIVKIQKDPNSAVKSLLWGHRYWSAQTNWLYDFDLDKASVSTRNTSVRPVFDTYDKSE